MELVNINKRIDDLEKCIVENVQPLTIPIEHLFCNNMYIRSVQCPKGAILTSKIHKTEHPFCLSKGKVQVMNEKGDWIEISAPYNGVTHKGTRRVVLVLEDCVWTTFHNYKGLKEEFNSLPESEITKITDKIEKRIVSESVNTKKLRSCHTLQ